MSNRLDCIYRHVGASLGPRVSAFSDSARHHPADDINPIARPSGRRDISFPNSGLLAAVIEAYDKPDRSPRVVILIVFEWRGVHAAG